MFEISWFDPSGSEAASSAAAQSFLWVSQIAIKKERKYSITVGWMAKKSSSTGFCWALIGLETDI